MVWHWSSTAILCDSLRPYSKTPPTTKKTTPHNCVNTLLCYCYLLLATCYLLLATCYLLLVCSAPIEPRRDVDSASRGACRERRTGAKARITEAAAGSESRSRGTIHNVHLSSQMHTAYDGHCRSASTRASSSLYKCRVSFTSLAKPKAVCSVGLWLPLR